MVTVALMIAPPCISLFAAMTGLGLESVASPLFHFADWQEELTSLKWEQVASVSWVKQHDTSAGIVQGQIRNELFESGVLLLEAFDRLA